MMLSAISAKVATGQRRPSMFSWRRGMSIAKPFPLDSKQKLIFFECRERNDSR